MEELFFMIELFTLKYEGTAVKRDIAIGLESLLPRYMFPNLYRNLTELPRTRNGKVDRQALRRLYG